MLKYRWIINKYFPASSELTKNQREVNFNPYKLLESYREPDSEYFFGRNKDIDILLESVYRNKTSILFGESGVGKTSLLNAGLFLVLGKKGGS